MIFYITAIRTLAAMLITNAHYTGVYPIDIIANGGLLGDVLFFAVSGFCLANIKQSFLLWYKKRIVRIYPVIWIITSVYLLFGFYSFKSWTILDYFIYPTYYHFIASIIILYIPFYFVMKVKTLVNNIPKLMLGLFIIELIVYIFIYDKSTYHIDVVREPMIRFLFFQVMLLGGYFRKHNEKYLNKNRMLNWVILVIMLFTYFASKLIFSKFEFLSNFQLINQLVLFILLYFILKCFAGINGKLERLPSKIKNIISLIANITLEVYVVQYVIISRWAFLVFPLNWLVITTMIIISAFILHLISSKIIRYIEVIINKATLKYVNGGHSSV